MNLVETRRVSEVVVATLPKVKAGYTKVYTCDWPIQSPEYTKAKDVIGWYAGLSEKEKLVFKKSGGFVISELSVALMDTIVDGETFFRGEVFAEKDVMKYDYMRGKWMNLED